MVEKEYNEQEKEETENETRLREDSQRSKELENKYDTDEEWGKWVAKLGQSGWTKHNRSSKESHCEGQAGQRKRAKGGRRTCPKYDNCETKSEIPITRTAHAHARSGRFPIQTDPGKCTSCSIPRKRVGTDL